MEEISLKNVKLLKSKIGIKYSTEGYIGFKIILYIIYSEHKAPFHKSWSEADFTV